MSKNMMTCPFCSSVFRLDSVTEKSSGTEERIKVLEQMCCEFSDRTSDLEDALKTIAKGCYDAEGCTAIAKQVLEQS